MKTVILTEDFSDDQLIFPRTYTLNGANFVHSTGTSLHNTTGYLRSDIKGVNSGVSYVTFLIDIPQDAIDPKVYTEYALSSARLDNGAIVLNKAMAVNITNTMGGNIINSNTSPLIKGVNEYSATYVKTVSGNAGLDELQLCKVQVTYQLDEVEQSQAPNVTVSNVSKETISDEPDMNLAVIKVQFDKAVTNYVARLNGSDHNTGTLVHEGGAVAIGVDADILIDWNELNTEGRNRINIYGKGEDGLWTPYTSDTK